jgi:hypothetical protein
MSTAFADSKVRKRDDKNVNVFSQLFFYRNMDINSIASYERCQMKSSFFELDLTRTRKNGLGWGCGEAGVGELRLICYAVGITGFIQAKALRRLRSTFLRTLPFLTLASFPVWEAHDGATSANASCSISRVV